jgi:hypothetical protein
MWSARSAGTSSQRYYRCEVHARKNVSSTVNFAAKYDNTCIAFGQGRAPCGQPGVQGPHLSAATGASSHQEVVCASVNFDANYHCIQDCNMEFLVQKHRCGWPGV